MSKSERCATCRFWLDREDDVSGSCRRFPPLAVGGGDKCLDRLGLYPLTSPDDWCGEWAATAKAKADAKAALAKAQADAEALAKAKIDAQADVSVRELNLSVRPRKAFYRLGITTLGQLIGKTASELLEAKNFGMTGLDEVRRKLAACGLRLKGDA